LQACDGHWYKRTNWFKALSVSLCFGRASRTRPPRWIGISRARSPPVSVRVRVSLTASADSRQPRGPDGDKEWSGVGRARKRRLS
jgi:hypothetical protein